jgi:hypothetical protein
MLSVLSDATRDNIDVIHSPFKWSTAAATAADAFYLSLLVY